jgi:Ca2+-binding EF-hand superfamily protein
MGNVKGNLKEFQEIMLEVDQDGDGLVNYSEFLAASINKAKLLSTQNLQIAFQMLDSDKNGVISLKELKEVFDA